MLSLCPIKPFETCLGYLNHALEERKHGYLSPRKAGAERGGSLCFDTWLSCWAFLTLLQMQSKNICSWRDLAQNSIFPWLLWEAAKHRWCSKRCTAQQPLAHPSCRKRVVSRKGIPWVWDGDTSPVSPGTSRVRTTIYSFSFLSDTTNSKQKPRFLQHYPLERSAKMTFFFFWQIKQGQWPFPRLSFTTEYGKKKCHVHKGKVPSKQYRSSERRIRPTYFINVCLPEAITSLSCLTLCTAIAPMDMEPV